MSEEVLVAEIPVSHRLEMGAEHLILFLTSLRLIIAHVGKRGRGQMVGIGMLGSLSGAMETVVTAGGEAKRKGNLQNRTPREILAANKDNFAMKYDEIVKVDVTGGKMGAIITVLTSREKLEFSTRLSMEKFEAELANRLGEKLSVTRL